MVVGQTGYTSLASSTPGVDEWRASGGALQAAQRLRRAGGALHAHAQRLGDPGIAGLPPQQVPMTCACSAALYAGHGCSSSARLHSVQPTHPPYLGAWSPWAAAGDGFHGVQDAQDASDFGIHRLAAGEGKPTLMPSGQAHPHSCLSCHQGGTAGRQAASAHARRAGGHGPQPIPQHRGGRHPCWRPACARPQRYACPHLPAPNSSCRRHNFLVQ